MWADGLWKFVCEDVDGAAGYTFDNEYVGWESVVCGELDVHNQSLEARPLKTSYGSWSLSGQDLERWEGVYCSGHEKSLNECTRSPYVGSDRCGGTRDNVMVMCSTSNMNLIFLKLKK